MKKKKEKFTEKEIVMSHACDLIELAGIDGPLNDAESEIIESLFSKYKLTKAEISKIVSKPTEIKVALPEKYEQRFEQLYRAVLLMICDGNANAQELAFCKKMADDLSFNSSVIIDFIIDIDAKTKN